jgi:predicted dehydrogenase
VLKRKAKSAGKKLRIGLIGAGGISKTHCSGWRKIRGAELVAVTDLHRKAAETRAEEFGFGSVEKDAAALLRREDIDAVDICTANRSHKPLTVAALAAGKHVLCEKPLALTAREVDEMIAAAVKARKILMCAQHHRFGHAARALKRHISSTRGSLGEVYYARARFNRRRLLPWGKSFIYKKNSGGGPCIDVGVHILDLALHLMDNFEPVSVTGIAVNKLAKQPGVWSEWDWGCVDKKGIDVEDFAAGLIRFKNGAALSLECSFMLNMKGQGEMGIDLFGTKAGANWPSCEIYDHTPTDYLDSKIQVREVGEADHHAEIAAFADAVRRGRPSPVPPAQSRAVIAILDGLYRSAKTGREVRL